MSDEEEKTEEKPKAGKSKLMLILVGVNMLAMVGVGAYLAFGQSSSAVADDAPEGAAEEEAEETEGFGPLVEMPPIVVNLNDPNGGRYIKVTPYLEARNDDSQVTIEEAVVPVRSRLIMYFAGIQVADTVGTEKKMAIAEELVGVINEVLGGNHVRRVFFTDFVIQ